MRTFLILLAVMLLLPTFVSCGNHPPDSTAYVPILMYHNFTADDESGSSFTVTISRFDEHLTALENAGYRTVTFADLIDYVYYGGELPERPVLLTSDDGYTGVPDLAAPCAARHGMTLSCAVIGALAGVNGHFSFDIPIPENVEIVSHTFALHDWNGSMGMIGSGFHGYERLLTEDIGTMREVCGERFPLTSSVLIYPHGSYSAESERILHTQGYSVTVTCDHGVAVIRRGEPGSLYLLPRISVWRDTTAEELMELIAKSE